MGIISALKNTGKSLKGAGLQTVAIKAAGVIGAGAVLVDAHSHAKVKGTMMERTYKTDSLTTNYMSNLKSDSPSAVRIAAKKRLFAFEADENLSGFFTNIRGYVGGFGSMLIDDIIPLGLSIGAAVTPKGLLSNGFGIGLLAYGGIFLAQEFFGLGKKH